jgi:hypothetical protein
MGAFSRRIFRNLAALFGTWHCRKPLQCSHRSWLVPRTESTSVVLYISPKYNMYFGTSFTIAKQPVHRKQLKSAFQTVGLSYLEYFLPGNRVLSKLCAMLSHETPIPPMHPQRKREISHLCRSPICFTTLALSSKMSRTFKATKA